MSFENSNNSLLYFGLDWKIILTPESKLISGTNVVHMNKWYTWTTGGEWIGVIQEAQSLSEGDYLYETVFDQPEIPNELWLCEIDMKFSYAADDYIKHIYVNDELVYSCGKNDKNCDDNEYSSVHRGEIHGVVQQKSNSLKLVVHNNIPKPNKDNPSGFFFKLNSIQLGICNTRHSVQDNETLIDSIAAFLTPCLMLYMLWRYITAKTTVPPKSPSTAKLTESIQIQTKIDVESSNISSRNAPSKSISSTALQQQQQAEEFLSYDDALDSSVNQSVRVKAGVTSTGVKEGLREIATANTQLTIAASDSSPMYEKLLSPLSATEKVDVLSVGSNISSYSSSTINSPSHQKRSKFHKGTKTAPRLHPTRVGSYEEEFNNKMRHLLNTTSNSIYSSGDITDNQVYSKRDKVIPNIYYESPPYIISDKSDHHSKCFVDYDLSGPSAASTRPHKQRTPYMISQSTIDTWRTIQRDIIREQGWRDVSMEDMIKL